jgi:hypothetical protein
MNINCRRFGVFIVDEGGICERCFNSKHAAWGWIDKHHPELKQEEKSRRIWTFASRNKVDKFFERQIRLGCTDIDVLACLTYYCGAATSLGLDLRNGKAKPIVDT